MKDWKWQALDDRTKSREIERACEHERATEQEERSETENRYEADVSPSQFNEIT